MPRSPSGLPVTADSIVYPAAQWRALQQRRRLLGDDALLALFLCAEWCAVCRDLKPVLATLAGKHPQTAFAYLDVEDDSEMIGALDIDDFPTLAVFRGDALVHFGVIKARPAAIAQLLAALRSPASSPLADPPAALRTLCALVRCGPASSLTASTT